MAVNLPPAERQYNRRNENQARRLTEQAFADLYARMQAAEEALAAGVSSPPDPDPVGPTAGFTFSAPASGLNVQFTDASTEGDAPITSRLWTWGDGTQSTAPNNTSPNHTFPDSGTYSVTLTVTDSDGLEDTSAPQDVTVTKPASGSRSVVLLMRGTDGVSEVPASCNAGQAAGMTPNNCVAMIDAFADAGMKCFVRLWRPNDAVDGNGIFSMSGLKASIDRYNTTVGGVFLPDYINARSQDGTIIYGSTMDDIKSVGRWGREVTRAEVDEICAYQRSLFFALPAWARARATQLEGFVYSSLQGIDSIYLANRGGVIGQPQAGGYTQNERVADCEAYRDQELAALANMEAESGYAFDMTMGLNIINGGDGSSNLPGDINGKYRVSANELTTYGDILIPIADGAYTYWQFNTDADTNSWFARSDIQAAFASNRALADAQS